MDDSSQNRAETEQKPVTENNGDYQKYLNSDIENKSKKRRKLIIFAGIGVMVLFAIVIAAVVLLTKDERPQLAVVTSCTDQSCFNERFKNCEPVTYVATAERTETQYEILGSDGDFCKLNAKFVSNPDEKYAGKDLTCKIDHTQEFELAEEDMLSNPADYDCEGSLVPILNVQNESNQGQ